MSIYTDLKQAGIEVEPRYSDLYIKDCPTARAILANHGRKVNTALVSTFIDDIDGNQWLDCAFCYDGEIEG